MKKLILLLIPFCMNAQLQTSTLLNIYPLGVTPSNYQAQPGPVNNNTIEATYNDSLQAVIYLTWGTNTLTSANSFGVKIENNYTSCSFPFTLTGSYVNFTNLIPISTGNGFGYYKFKFKLNGFTICSTNYTAYNLTIGGTASSLYASKIPFKVYPLSTGIQELTKTDVVKIERYNILGEPDPQGLIEVIYCSDNRIIKRKVVYLP